MLVLKVINMFSVVLLLCLFGAGSSQRAPIHSSGDSGIGLNGISPSAIDQFRKVKNFKKHPNDIMQTINDMMEPTRIGKQNLSHDILA